MQGNCLSVSSDAWHCIISSDDASHNHAVLATILVKPFFRHGIVTLPHCIELSVTFFTSIITPYTSEKHICNVHKTTWVGKLGATMHKVQVSATTVSFYTLFAEHSYLSKYY